MVDISLDMKKMDGNAWQSLFEMAEQVASIADKQIQRARAKKTSAKKSRRK